MKTITKSIIGTAAVIAISLLLKNKEKPHDFEWEHDKILDFDGPQDIDYDYEDQNFDEK